MSENRIAELPNGEKVEQEPTGEQAALKVLEDARRQRIDLCGKEVAAVLERYNCTIDVAMIIKAGSITPQISIISRT